jgi:septal ring factor EnvC (AmiA/AmiB activator)
MCRFRIGSASRRQALGRPVGSIAFVTAFWIALAVLVVAFVAGVVFVVVRALETRRALKSLRSELGVELKRIAHSGERTASELEAARKAFERLEASLARLRTARARVRVLKEVLAEAEAVLARARVFVPSK